MQNLLRPCLSLFILLTLLTGVVYPFLVTGIAQLVFPYEANGSLIKQQGNILGSRLIGQHFTSPRYFWGRLSATTSHAYNPLASSGSNYGPLNPAFMAAVTARKGKLGQNSTEQGSVPVDLVTASGSGLDPDISPAAALYQVERIAKVRHLAVVKVRNLVTESIIDRQFTLLGEPRVNVLTLNLMLDQLK